MATKGKRYTASPRSGMNAMSGLSALGALAVWKVATTWWLGVPVIASYVFAWVLTHSPKLEHHPWNLATKVADKVEFTSWAAVAIWVNISVLAYAVVMVVWPILHMFAPWWVTSTAWDSPRVVGRMLACAALANAWIYDVKGGGTH